MSLARLLPLGEVRTALLVVVFFAARLLLLTTRLEDLSVNDELTTGVFSQYLQGATLLPISGLWSPRMGGDAVYQVLSSPLYLVLGDTLLTVKVLALLVGLWGLWVVTWVAARTHGATAGLWAGLLYALAPPGWMGQSLVGTGDHFLTGIFAVLAGHLTLETLRGRGSARDQTALLLGILSGFAFFANFLFAVPLGATAVCLVGMRSTEPWTPRSVGALFVGGVLGATPLWATLAVQGLSTTTTIYPGQKASDVYLDAAAVLGRSAEILTMGLPGSGWFPHTLLGSSLAGLWVAGLAVGLGLALVGVGRTLWAAGARRPAAVAVPLEAWLIAFFALFVLAFALTRFDLEPRRLFGFRYVTVLYAGACVLLGGRLASLGPPVAAGLAASWLLPSGLGLLLAGLPEDPGRIVRYPGVTWTNAAPRALERWGEDLEAALRDEVPLLPPRERGPFLVGVGAKVAHRLALPKTVALAVSALADEDQTPFLAGAFRKAPRPRGRADAALTTLADALPAPHGGHAVAALRGSVASWGTGRLSPAALPTLGWAAPLGAEWMGSQAHRRTGTTGVTQLADTLPPDLASAAWFGAGVATAEAPAFDPVRAAAAAPGVQTPTLREAYLEGLAWPARRNPDLQRQPVATLLAWTASLPPETHTAYAHSAGWAATAWIDRSTWRLADRVQQLKDPALRTALCQGMGRGAVAGSKTPTDLLRWRIAWDGHGGPCSQAVADGMAAEMDARLRAAPGYHDDLRTRLRLGVDP